LILKNLIKNIILLSIALIFSLIFVEILLRVLKLDYGKSPLNRSKIFHHEHPKNYSFTMHDEDGAREFGGFKVFYENNGFRVKNRNIKNIFSKDKKNSIIFLGDSFTEGNQVLYEDTFVYKIGKKLNLETLNLGTASYSPIIYYSQILNLLTNIKSQIVIMQIYSNDFKNDYEYSKRIKILNNGKIAIDGGKNNKIIVFLRKFYVARFVKKNYLLIKTIINNYNNQNKYNGSEHEKKYLMEQNVNDIDFEYSSNIIQKINNELKNKNKKLMVFMIPSKSLSMKNQCCANDLLYKRFKKK